MECKLLTIRDTGTEMRMFALRVEPLIRVGITAEYQREILAAAGFGRTQADQYEYVILGDLNRLSDTTYDPHRWSSRTQFAAHMVLLKHWDRFSTGAVIDVRDYFDDVLPGTYWEGALPLRQHERAQ